MKKEFLIDWCTSYLAVCQELEQLQDDWRLSYHTHNVTISKLTTEIERLNEEVKRLKNEG